MAYDSRGIIEIPRGDNGPGGSDRPGVESSGAEESRAQGSSSGDGANSDSEYDAWGRIQREVANADYNLVARLASRGQAVLEPLISTANLQPQS